PPYHLRTSRSPSTTRFRATAIVGLGDRTHLEATARPLDLGPRARESRGFVHRRRYCLVRCGTVKWPVTRPPLWLTPGGPPSITADRKSTRLISSHVASSYA